MAETTENTQTETKTPAFDEAKLQESIRDNIRQSLEEYTRVERETRLQEQQAKKVEEDPGDDFWDKIIDPKVNKKVASSTVAAEAAQDKVDFYTSDEWLTESEAWLVSEDPEDRRKEKAELRDKVEKYFNNLLKSGRGMPRADLFNAVLGEKIKKDKTKFEENIGKRNKRKLDDELQQAQRGVDLTSVMASYTPESVHKMDWEKVEETYGSLVF